MTETLFQLYRRSLNKYHKFSRRLEKRIRNGCFFEQSRHRQDLQLARVEKYRQRFEGLRLQLGIAAVAGAAMVFSGQYASAQGPGLGPFNQITQRIDNPVRAPMRFSSPAHTTVDIDGDGDLDLFVGISNGSVQFYQNYKVELGGTENKFQQPFVNPYSAVGGYYSNETVEFADIDADGDLDAILSFDFGACYPTVFFRNTAGPLPNPPSFVYMGPFEVGNPLTDLVFSFNPRSNFTFVNIDADADLEAFVGGGVPTTYIQFINFNAGSGKWEAATSNLETIGFPNHASVAFLDADGDTNLDAFVANQSGYVTMYRGYGDGNFNLATPAASNPLDGIDFGFEPFIEFADVDGDGDLDFIASTSDYTTGSYEYASIRVFENTGISSNVFKPLTGLKNPFGGIDVGYSNDPSWVDIDGDADLDLFLGSQDNGVYFYENLNNVYGYTKLLRHKGAVNPLEFFTNTRSSPQFGDLDQDGDFDVYIGTAFDGLYYHKNNGSPVSASFSANDPGNSLITELEGIGGGFNPHQNDLRPTLGDMDGDGDLDAFVSSGYSVGYSMAIFENTGNPAPPAFVYVNQFSPYIGYRDVQLADLDHDGDADLVAGSYFGNTRFFTNNGGVFTEELGAANPFDAIFGDGTAPSFTDYDNDGDLDLFIGRKYGNLELYRNENQPVTLDLGAGDLNIPENTPALAGISVTIDDPDVIDNTEIVMVFVKMNNYVATEDVVGFTNQSNITGSFNAITGELTLTGSDSFANYQTAVSSITYQNTSDDPDPTPRLVDYQAWDSDFTDPIIYTKTINVIPINDPPAITSFAGTSATEDIAYTYAGVVNDPDDANNGTDLTWMLSGQPAGMTVNSTGLVSWTPGEGVITSGSVTLTVQDGEEDGAVPDSEVFTITVTPVNDQPTITSTAGTAATEDVTYTYTPTVVDPDDANNGDDLGWSLTGAPPGMTVSATGVVSWTPTEGVTTSGPVTLTVQDGGEDGTVPFSEVFTLSVTPVNDPPTLTVNTSTLLFIENGVPLDLDNLAAVSDPDATNVNFEITVAISNNYQNGQDVLTAAPSGPVSGSFSPGTGVLTISGVGTVTQFQTVLRSVQYQNTSDDPDVTPRDITVTVDDGTVQATPAVITLNINAVNDPPTVTGDITTLSYTGGSVLVDPSISLADLDNTILQSATVTIASGFMTGTDDLTFSLAGAITGTFDSGTGILSLSGSGTIAEYQSVLASVTYTNSLGLDVSTRTIEFVIDDGQDPSSTFTRNVNVSVTNTPPSALLTTTSFSYTENDGVVGIDPGISITDDSGTLTGAEIAITNNYDNGNDLLSVTNQFGITGIFDVPSGMLSLTGNGTTSEYETVIASLAFENGSEDPLDASRTIEIVLDDGTATSTVVSFSVQVTAVNDVPVLSGTSTDLSYRSLTPAVVIDDQLTVADNDDNDLVGASVQIQGFEAGGDLLTFTNQNGISGSFNAITGVLTLSGTSSVANYQTALRSVTFSSSVPTPNGDKTIDFLVSDVMDQSNTFSRVIDISSNVVTAIDIAQSVSIGSSVNVDVLAAATFDPADQITTSIISAPTKGTAVVNGGVITYMPGNNATGSDQLTYELCNEFNSCDTGIITISIQNSKPVFTKIEQQATPGTPLTIDLSLFVSDVENNIDPSSLRVTDPPRSGAPVTINGLEITIDYTNSTFSNAIDRLTIEICDLSGECENENIIIEVGNAKEVVVFNGISPNGDGINDYLVLEGIRFFPGNIVYIYNKIGNEVRKINDYDNSDLTKVFDGLDDEGNELADGTYYFVIELEGSLVQSGFFVVKR